MVIKKKIDRKTIATDLQKNEKRSETINILLDNVSQWDAAFHNVRGKKFEINQYNIEEGK